MLHFVYMYSCTLNKPSINQSNTEMLCVKLVLVLEMVHILKIQVSKVQEQHTVSQF